MRAKRRWRPAGLLLITVIATAAGATEAAAAPRDRMASREFLLWLEAYGGDDGEVFDPLDLAAVDQPRPSTERGERKDTPPATAERRNP